jgi:serine/threonine protein kinase/WD40 repeat protein
VPVPSTLAQFAELCRSSGVVEDPALTAYLKELSKKQGRPKTVADLADRMVADGILTRFQAKLLLQGKRRGFVISGKYVLLDRLGSGGMASVFLCRHRVMRRHVAIKVLPDREAGDPLQLERFHREARAVATLDHPNIVRAHDIDCDGKMHFLVMEYVDGSNLDEIVQKHGRLEVKRAMHYICQAAHGLQHAHEAGLVHRDIKPANLLLDRNGVVKILDMGLARFFREERDNLTQEHDRQSVLGTADYLAPEQALDSHAVDIRADIYSLGVTFYFLLTGSSPFQGGSIAQKLIWHQVRTPKAIREVRPEVPVEVAEAVDRMLAKDPDQRFQTPAEVVDALLPFVQEPLAPPSENEMPVRCAALRRDEPTPSVTPVLPLSTLTTTARRSLKQSVALSTVATATTESTFDLNRAAERETRAPAKKRPRRRRTWKWAAVVAGGLLLAAVVGAGTYRAIFGGDSRRPDPFPWRGDRTGSARIFAAHSAQVESVAVAPDGKHVLTGSADRTMLLWDLETGEVLRSFQGFNGIVYFVDFSPDGRLAVSASGDGTVRLWNWRTGEEVRRCEGHEGAVHCAAFNRDGSRLASAGEDRTVRIWETATGVEVQRCEGHDKGVWWVVWSPDGRAVLSAGKDASIRLWDAQFGTEKQQFRGHRDEVRRVAFSADGSRILSGSFDTTMRLWDTRTGQQVREYPGTPYIVESVTFLPDGKHALSTEGPDMSTGRMVVGPDHGIRVWDLESGRLLRRLGGVHGKVFQLRLHNGGKQALTVGSDSLLRLWQLPALD